MGNKLPLIPCNKLLKFLLKEGFVELRQNVSLKFLKHPDGRTTVISIHGNEEIGRGLLKSILEEIGISHEEFFFKYK